jgi:hypothetical protein
MSDHATGTETVSGARDTLSVTIEGETAVLSAEYDAEMTVAAVLEALARQHGRPELVTLSVTVEDADEHIVTSIQVRELLGDRRRGRVHLHRCHRLKVTITYNNNKVEHEFSPASTVERVFKWCIAPEQFNVEADAHELALELPGATAPLEPHVHVGTLTRDRRCDLALDLVSHDRHQG